MRTALLILACLYSVARAQDHIALTTKSGDKVHVTDKGIQFNGRSISGPVEGIIVGSGLNRIIEQHGVVLLFLAIDGRPGRDHIAAYKITPTNARELANTVYSKSVLHWPMEPFTDLDGDGVLEFGGSDLTEAHPSKDSMYYVPSSFYEVKDGTVVFDSALTRAVDIRSNGIYLKYPLDHDGNCCVVVKRPIRKK